MDKDPTPLIRPPPLIRPLYFGPLVVVLTGFHCITLIYAVMYIQTYIYTHIQYIYIIIYIHTYINILYIYTIIHSYIQSCKLYILNVHSYTHIYIHLYKVAKKYIISKYIFLILSTISILTLWRSTSISQWIYSHLTIKNDWCCIKTKKGLRVWEVEPGCHKKTKSNIPCRTQNKFKVPSRSISDQYLSVLFACISRVPIYLITHIIIWLTDFVCCDWSIPGP